jgi:hypothetical protein
MVNDALLIPSTVGVGDAIVPPLPAPMSVARALIADAFEWFDALEDTVVATAPLLGDWSLSNHQLDGVPSDDEWSSTLIL